MAKQIYNNEEDEILFMNNEVFFIHNDKVYYFNPNDCEELVLFVRLMKHCGIRELERARILGKIMNLVDKS